METNSKNSINDLRICSYNCRSIKNSMHDVLRLCKSHDIICLQEHWLLPTELGFLSNIHKDFYGTGCSAVDITNDVLIGRPYGGTAILYRKSLCNSVTILPSSNSCVAGLNINLKSGPLLLLTVYMPTDYNDEDSLEKYIDVCANLSAIFIDCDTPHVVIIGDFNCQPGTRFFPVLKHLMDDNKLVMTDLSLLSTCTSVFTYCSDSGANTSWIDHVICSHEMNNNVCDLNVLYDFTCSDHRPLSLRLKCLPSVPLASNGESKSSQSAIHDWTRVDDSIANLYSDAVYERLSKLAIPDSLFSCCNGKCNDLRHFHAIDNYYNAVIDCITGSINEVIPVKTICNNQFNVPGWNDFVQDKYDSSREAFLDWVSCGRPRTGAVFACMSRSRASFKLALRYCRQHEDQLRADACAKALDLHDAKSFWKNVKKVNSNKATLYANCVGDVCGDDNIASMWRDHFKSLYSSVDDVDGSKDKFYARIKSSSNAFCYSNTNSISVQDISIAVSKQKKGKAAGPDGIAMEAFMYGHHILYVHLSLLFNLFITHCHIPSMFMKSVIVPLVKIKGGDLTDVNNYRAIALSNTISKILESIFINRVTSVSASDSYQFGFKTGHSTGLCTNTMKKVVEYYTARGSHVFACFVDFSKAFDKVNYWKLFNKLLDDSIDCDIVAFLAKWYSSQEACIQWKHTISNPFKIANGTRQGGILSPYFFTRYIRELICAIVQSNIGCNIGGVFFNILAYADDMVLLAPSWKALQSLISLLSHYALIINMLFNVDKTVCMVFNPKCKRMIVATDFPCFTLDGAALEFVREFKYLGHMINNVFSDDSDVKREIRNFFVRSNILIRRYSKCSVGVKQMLFKAYCMCLYDAGIWKYYSATVYNKFRSCYNKCIKMFFGYDRRFSVTEMLSELNLPCFDNLISDCVRNFSCRWSISSNDIVTHLRDLQL